MCIFMYNLHKKVGERRRIFWNAMILTAAIKYDRLYSKKKSRGVGTLGERRVYGRF